MESSRLYTSLPIFYLALLLAKPANIRSPTELIRYFCLLLVGFSGIVISIALISSAGII